MALTLMYYISPFLYLDKGAVCVNIPVYMHVVVM
jgi:hypothetical protein